MAYGANRYNPSGWSDGFNGTRDAIRGYQQDNELAAAQDDPGLSSMLSLNGQSEGGGIQAPGGAPGMPGMPSPDPGLALAQRQAAVYRKFGNTDQADKVMQAQAQLGLTNVQTREGAALADQNEMKATTLRKGNARQDDIDAIERDVASKASTLGIDGSTLDGGLQMNKMRVKALLDKGYFDHAKIASDNAVTMQGNALKSQTAERQVASNDIVNASRMGRLTPELVSSFHDKFVPDGTTAKSVTVNKDGGFTMVTIDKLNGNESTQTVKGGELPNLFGMLGSADSAGAITAQLAAKSKADLERAQASHANASAGSASAMADRTRAATKQDGLDNAFSNNVRQARFNQNLPGPASESDNAYVGAADDASASRRNAAGEAKKPWSFLKDPMGNITGRTNGATGEVEVLDEKTGKFTPRGDGPSPAVGAASNIAKPASKADYDALPKGSSYIDPTGRQRVKS
jgi:hypothetical protein